MIKPPVYFCFLTVANTSRRPFPALRTRRACDCQKCLDFPQARQRERRYQLSGVVFQHPLARSYIAELTLDSTKRVLDLGTYLGLDLLDFALGFEQYAATEGDLPDDLMNAHARDASRRWHVTRTGKGHPLRRKTHRMTPEYFSEIRKRPSELPWSPAMKLSSTEVLESL